MEIELINRESKVKARLAKNRNKVITIFMQSNTEIDAYTLNYRILDNSGIVILCNAEDFEIVDPFMEQDWVFKKSSTGNIEILPQCIAYDYFWDDFFNDDSHAIETFKKRFPEFADILF